MEESKVEVLAEVGQSVQSPWLDGSALYFTVPDAGEVWVMDVASAGEPPRCFAQTGGSPAGVAVSGDGSVFVADEAFQAVLQVEGGSREVLVGEYEGSPLRGPNSLHFDSDGNLLFTDGGPRGETSLADASGSVFCVTSGKAGQLLQPLVLGGLARPSGVAAATDGSGIVYVTEQDRNRVLRFAQRPRGVFHGTVFHQFSGRMGPSAAVCGHDGTLYVARYELSELSQHGVISVLDREGSLVREITVDGAEVTGLTLSEDGDALFVTEASRGRILRVQLA